MSDSGLVTSLVGSLAWPALVAAALIGFHEPLKDLIDRLKSAKVAGQEFEFGPKLRDAEDKSNAAISDAPVPPDRENGRPLILSLNKWESRHPLALSPGLRLFEEDPTLTEETPTEPTPNERAETARYTVGILARDAEANPSFTILQAWENLSYFLVGYIDLVLAKGQRGRFSLTTWLQAMEKQKEVTPSFVEAVKDVQRLRNAVAHGEHIPTPGEAVAYVDTVSKLAYVAALQRALYEEARKTATDASAPSSAKSAEAEPSGDGSQR